VEATTKTVPNQVPTNNQSQLVNRPSPTVILKEGKNELRFGPVVTGQIALGKDGCGY